MRVCKWCKGHEVCVCVIGVRGMRCACVCKWCEREGREVCVCVNGVSVRGMRCACV